MCIRDRTVIDPWVNLGVIYGRNEQLEDAAFALRQALRIDPGDLSSTSNLYEVYIEQQNFEAAAALETRVERYRRKNPYYLLRLSNEALVQQQYADSISLLQKAIRKKDDDHKLYFALAKTQYLSGEVVKAQSSLLRAKELAPKDMIAYYDRPLDELVSEAQVTEERVDPRCFLSVLAKFYNAMLCLTLFRVFRTGTLPSVNQHRGGHLAQEVDA